MIPYTLAENAGLNPIQIVTELKNHHAKGCLHHGINVRKGTVTNILDENVVQPLQVSNGPLLAALDDDENKPAWPTWAVGVLSGVRNVETYNRGRPSQRYLKGYLNS